MHQNINGECKEDKYFGDEVETLCNKEKNHSGAAKPKKFTNIRNSQLQSSRTHIPLML
jgi:hypothetical protein